MTIFRAPFLFLSIRFPGRWTYILVLPFISASFLTAILYILRDGVNIVGTNGLFSKLLSVMPIAGGFFVAALTVILSQSNSVLQAGFSGSSKPVLISDGEPMTRQRFLALLFGYLSFSSFTLSGVLVGTDLFSSPIRAYFSADSWALVSNSTTWVILFWVTQMFSCSLIGLYYLTDRLYRSSGNATFKRDLPVDEP